MRKLYFVPLLAAFMAVGCDDDNPTQPSEITPTFQMNLLASNETPTPIVAPDPEATCAGSVTIRMNITRDANNNNTITAATFDFQANITGCPTSTVINIAHIHEQVAGQTGSIVVNTGLAAGQLTLVNGAGSFTANGRQANNNDLSIAQRILDNPSGFYFNIHSSAHGSGVIRAQLVRVQ